MLSISSIVGRASAGPKSGYTRKRRMGSSSSCSWISVTKVHPTPKHGSKRGCGWFFTSTPFGARHLPLLVSSSECVSLEIAWHSRIMFAGHFFKSVVPCLHTQTCPSHPQVNIFRLLLRLLHSSQAAGSLSLKPYRSQSIRLYCCAFTICKCENSR